MENEEKLEDTQRQRIKSSSSRIVDNGDVVEGRNLRCRSGKESNNIWTEPQWR